MEVSDILVDCRITFQVFINQIPLLSFFDMSKHTINQGTEHVIKNDEIIILTEEHGHL